MRAYSEAAIVERTACPRINLNLDSPVLVEVFLVEGFFFANLYQSALGGWLSTRSVIST
jgi:hypothetical protein